MTKHTVSPDGGAMPAEGAGEIDRHKAFAAAYHTWLKARAAMTDPNWPEDDAAAKQRFIDERAAERALFLLPAISGDMLWSKLEVLEHAISDHLHVGPRNEDFILLAIGAIKSDFLNLRFNDATEEDSHV